MRDRMRFPRSRALASREKKRLHRLGIVTVEDLLTHYPREYKGQKRNTENCRPAAG